MAERRMFAKTIVLSDAFLDLPMSARCLYFTLGMVADDDGFVNSPRSIMRQIGASDDDIKLLIAKRFVLIFDSGVIVIKHWRMNNYLQKDRIKPTAYQDELALLEVDKNGAYTEAETPCIQNVYTDKNSIDKDSIEQSSKEQERLGVQGERKPADEKETPIDGLNDRPLVLKASLRPDNQRYYDAHGIEVHG